MPKTIKKRTVKKTERDSGLGESVIDIREKIKERQKTLAFGGIAFLCAVIIIGAFVIYSRVTTAKAMELEYEGIKIMDGSSAAPYASPADRFRDALAKFKASWSEKKNPVVLLYIANCHYELGNFDEAIKSLKELTSRYSDIKIISPAYYKMAMSYVSKGDLNSALKTFDTLVKIKDALFQDMALFESGKILETMGRTEEAKQKYRELINMFPGSPLVSEAKSKLGGA